MPVTSRRSSPKRRAPGVRCHRTIGFHLPPITARAASSPQPYAGLLIASPPAALGVLTKRCVLAQLKATPIIPPGQPDSQTEDRALGKLDGKAAVSTGPTSAT